MNYNRRTFIKGMAAATAAIPFANAYAFAASEPLPINAGRFPIGFFSKPLDGYEPEFIAETLAKAGLDGLDLTVRPKGKIEPLRVETDLPKIIETFAKYKLKTDMIVTSILEPEAEDTIRVIKTAGKLGVKHYRMGWYDYDFKKGVWESLPVIRKKLESLAALNKANGIQGGYQNHSGNKVGGPVWDVWELLRGLPVEWISSQYDVRHAVAEGAFSWTNGMRLLQKNIGSLAIKDFTWEVANGKAKIVNVALGEGIVDFDQYFKLVKELNIAAPITLHIEYPLLTADEEKLPLLQQQAKMVPRIRKDVDFVKSFLTKYQLA